MQVSDVYHFDENHEHGYIAEKIQKQNEAECLKYGDLVPKWTPDHGG